MKTRFSYRPRKSAWLGGIRLSALVMASLFWVHPSMAATTVNIEADATQYEEDRFRVDVTVTDIDDFYGIAFDLAYDPEYLEVADQYPMQRGLQPWIEQGALLNNGGTEVTLVQAALEDDTPGTLVVGVSRSGDVAGVSTTAKELVFSVYFYTKKIGQTAISFQQQGVKDSNADTILVSIWGDNFPVDIEEFAWAKGDINHDNLVDLEDAVIAMTTLGGIRLPDVYAVSADVDNDARAGLAEAAYALGAAAGLQP